jgi:hypothetical protein
VENRILKLDDSLTNFHGVMDYLDSVKLFDRSMLDQNAIRHLVYNLQEKFDQKVRRLWTDHQYHMYERFMQMHKPCGLYAKLILISEEQTKKPPVDSEQISFVIKGQPELQSRKKVTNLQDVRSRKY